METASTWSEVSFGEAGIRVVCGVEDGGVGTGGRVRGRGDRSGGNSPVVTCDGERKKKHLKKYVSQIKHRCTQAL